MRKANSNILNTKANNLRAITEKTMCTSGKLQKHMKMFFIFFGNHGSFHTTVSFGSVLQ